MRGDDVQFRVDGVPIPQGSKTMPSNILSGRIEAASKEWWNTLRGLTLNQVELIGGLAMNATRLCSVDGCERTFSCKGMCEMHYSRMRRTGTTEPREKYPVGAICSVGGCTRPRKGREWCAAHWLRWRKYGDPLGSAGVNGVDWNVRRDCKIDGCGNKAHARELCQKHFARWRKHGDPLHVAPITGRPLNGEMPTWAAIHKRLFRTYGPARDRPCVDCGRSADEWSYRGGSPNELIGRVGRFMCAYTEDLSYYEPRCTSCHRKFDGAGSRPRTARGTFVSGEVMNVA